MQLICLNIRIFWLFVPQPQRKQIKYVQKQPKYHDIQKSIQSMEILIKNQRHIKNKFKHNKQRTNLIQDNQKNLNKQNGKVENILGWITYVFIICK